MSPLFVGIDLAAQARSTGLAVLRDDGERCRIDQALLGVEDTALLTAI